MINPKEIKVSFENLTKVLHIADTHIRLFKRHKEYSEAFETLYKDLENAATEGTVIFLGGDVCHAKIELSPELIQLTSQFLSKIADIAPGSGTTYTAQNFALGAEGACFELRTVDTQGNKSQPATTCVAAVPKKPQTFTVRVLRGS